MTGFYFISAETLDFAIRTSIGNLICFLYEVKLSLCLITSLRYHEDV
jgi:hypothetical protein